jgi:glycerophosphoryl diester phosphodiesterase
MKVFAHRGASGHEPENTLLAIDAALQMKVDAIEIDIHLVDEQLIVIHDRWLHHTTNGQGRISDKGLAEIRALDAGKGQQVPLLWEVLERVGASCELNIELKSARTVEPLLAMLNEAIAKLGCQQQQFLISSFNHHLLAEIKSQDPDWRVGALTASLPIDYAKFGQKLGAYSVHICMDLVNQAFVKDAHKRGMKVYVYTVDQDDDINDLIAIGVDGIFSNYPTRSMVKLAHLKV